MPPRSTYISDFVTSNDTFLYKSYWFVSWTVIDINSLEKNSWKISSGLSQYCASAEIGDGLQIRGLPFVGAITLSVQIGFISGGNIVGDDFVWTSPSLFLDTLDVLVVFASLFICDVVKSGGFDGIGDAEFIVIIADGVDGLLLRFG